MLPGGQPRKNAFLNIGPHQYQEQCLTRHIKSIKDICPSFINNKQGKDRAVPYVLIPYQAHCRETLEAPQDYPFQRKAWVTLLDQTLKEPTT